MEVTRQVGVEGFGLIQASLSISTFDLHLSTLYPRAYISPVCPALGSKLMPARLRVWMKLSLSGHFK